MRHPRKSSKLAHGGKALDDSEKPSNKLWVGNLSSDVSDLDLMTLFSKDGAVDGVTSYASRGYGFVYYKRVEDAKAAREALQGTVLHGNLLKIEFARPAKPCKSLWVSGISRSITKESLEEDFLTYGKIEEFKFLKDRNTAYVDYFRLEDASQALNSMNGKRIGGEQIRVDFLRSHTSRRENWVDNHAAREGQLISLPMGPPKTQQNSYSSGGQKADGHPSTILWIGYPPSVHVDEQMLYNAMILFGEIERIKSFPSRHYSFVEFRSVDEALRAKEGLQGRLFNDPRISIMYSRSGLAPIKDYPEFYTAVKGPRPDVFFNEPPFQPALVDMFNHNRAMAPSALSGPAPSGGILGPNMLMRPFGPQGSFEPLLSGKEFNDLSALHSLPDANSNGLMGGPSWRRLSPASGMLPSPLPGMKRQIGPVSGAWDVFDANQLQRESKRSRIDTVLPVYDSPLPSKKMGDCDLRLDQLYGLGPQVDGGASGPLANVQEKNRSSPAEIRFPTGGAGQAQTEHDYIWRGVIAKGGTPVCRARCVPLGKGIESEMPEVVNCSSRTSLEMLTKHYGDAIEFSVVFFLPDSEEDFALYTEFLRYLGTKNRVGVAKFDDGTTLFLVPPSDFLSKVLNVAGPERLYGVALKFPQQAPSSASTQPQSHFMDKQLMPSQNEYSGMPQKEEKVLQMDYNGVLRGDSLPNTKQLAPSTIESIPMQPAASVSTAAVSQAGVLLTPELIATLASLRPASAKSSGCVVAQSPLGTSSMRPSLPPNTELDRLLPHGWTYDHQGTEQTGHPLPQMENQNNSQRQQLARLQTCPTGLNTSSNSALGVTGSSQFQDLSYHLPQQGVVSSRLLSNFGIPSQSGQPAVFPQVGRRHQYEVPQNTREGFGMAHGTDSLGSCGSSVYQQPANSVTLFNQVRVCDVTMPHTAMPLGAGEGNSELPNQVHQLQSGASQRRSEVEVDKNQLYQLTLQYAANLLQAKQQHQQTNIQGGQGSANH